MMQRCCRKAQNVDFSLAEILSKPLLLMSMMVLDICRRRSRDGRPVPRGTLPAGKGGFPAPPRAVGRGGFPAPPRPVKMIKTAGKLRGKINTRISTFSKRGKK